MSRTVENDVSETITVPWQQENDWTGGDRYGASQCLCQNRDKASEPICGEPSFSLCMNSGITVEECLNEQAEENSIHDG